MSVVIRVVEVAGEQTLGRDPAGLYVVGCDIDAHDGRGEVDLTADPAKARVFPSVAYALGYYRRVSRVRPVRPDGMPNRPLCAYTVEVLPTHDVIH